MLDYKLVEAFALVVIEGGFEKAARKLHLTQSAVSQRVKQLEDQYGCVLLQRVSPPQPTEQGVPLLVHYRRVSQLETDLLPARKDTDSQRAFTTLAVGVNADSLATWFFPAIRELLMREQLTLDLNVDDQEVTHELLQEGKVWGCISTRRQPLQGCRVTRLGAMKYGVFATRLFADKWFADGFTLSAAECAPMACYNRKDDLNARMFSLLFNDQPANPPFFFVPSSEMYCRFVAESVCYGILPHMQSKLLEAAGEIINLTPSHCLHVELYWHCWNLRSAMMERFHRQLLTGSRRLMENSAN